MHSLVEQWHAAAASCLPPGVEVWDAHTHTGDTDPDGYSCDPQSLLAGLEAAGHKGAVVTPSANPDGYRDANDRVLLESKASGGRLIPFLRIDPRDDEAVGAIPDAVGSGFRGVKIHPRSESFAMEHDGVAAVFAAAAASRVPVLIHAGRGIPPLGRALLGRMESAPGSTVVLAHAAISDLGWLGPEAGGRHDILFDTAWWNAADLLALFGSVDATQIVYASDSPYWTPSVASTIAARSALQAGLSGDGLAAVFGGNLHRILSGDITARPLGVGLPGPHDPDLLRVASNLYTAIGAVRSGGSGAEPMELALRAAEASATPHRDLLAAIALTVEAARSTLEPHPLSRVGAVGMNPSEQISLLLLACSAALTPAAPAPAL